jgi:hypothetical protein
VTDPRRRGEQVDRLGELRVAGQVLADGGLDGGDRLAEAGDVALHAPANLRVEGVGLARLLARPHGDKRIAAAMQARQALARRIGGLRAPQGQAGAHERQKPRIEGVGLGALAERLGEGAGMAGVDAGRGEAGLRQRLAQGHVVDAGGLEHHQAVGRQLAGERREGGGRVGEARPRRGGGREHIEMMLGDVDSGDLRV